MKAFDYSPLWDRYSFQKFADDALNMKRKGGNAVVLMWHGGKQELKVARLFGEVFDGHFDNGVAYRNEFLLAFEDVEEAECTADVFEECGMADSYDPENLFFTMRLAGDDGVRLLVMIGREYEATSKDRKEMFLADFPDFRCEQDCGDRAFRSFDDNNFERLERIAHVYGFELHLFKNHIDYGNTYEPIDVCGEYREESAKCADHFLCVYDNVQDAVNQLHAEMEGLDPEDDADFIESNRKEIETLRGMYVSADEFIIHRRTEGNGLIEIKKRHLTAANIGESHLAILLTITD